jgi:predicted  nucleic acid-binding Zn-ribbon protein
MRKIAAAGTCTIAAVALVGCGGMSKETTRQLASQRTQIAKAKTTLADQRATLVADQAALTKRETDAVADIRKARDRLSGQASNLRRTVHDLKSQARRLRGEVRSENSTLAVLQAKASGARYLVRHNSIPGTGTFLVNKEITPGTYRAAASPGCYWEREASLDGGVESIADNDNADGPVIVAISSTDAAFKTDGCGTFHKVG